MIMRADLIDITDGYVRLKTDFGIFRGNWMSDVKPINARYLIEINCDTVTDENQIQLSATKQSFIRDYGDYSLINAFVEEIEDNVIFLRLSYSLMMVDFLCDINSVKFQNQWVTVKVHRLEIYGELIN